MLNIQTRPGLRTFFRNITSVYAVNVLNGILGVIVVPIAVHVLGVSRYGIFSIYSVLAGYIALVDLGITKNLSRLLAGDEEAENRSKHLQTVFGLYLTISAAMIILLPLIIYLVSKYVFPVGAESIGKVKWIAALAIVEFIIAVPAAMMQTRCIADERFERYSKFTLVSGLYRYGFMFAGILIFKQPEMVVVLVVSRRLIDAFAARWIMGGLPKGSWRARFDAKDFRLMIGSSAALSIAQLFQITIVAIGSVLINRFSGIEALGIYRSAFDLASKIWFFSNAIGLVVFPRFVRTLAVSGNRTRLFSYLPSVFNLSWAGYALISMTGALASSFFLDLLGLRLTITQNMFILLLFGVSMNAHANLSYEFLQSAGRYWSAARLSGLAVSLMIVIFFGLYNRIGMPAIGWAWIMSQVIYAMIADALTLAQAQQSGKVQLYTLFVKLSIFSANIIVVSLTQRRY